MCVCTYVVINIFLAEIIICLNTFFFLYMSYFELYV